MPYEKKYEKMWMECSFFCHNFMSSSATTTKYAICFLAMHNQWQGFIAKLAKLYELGPKYINSILSIFNYIFMYSSISFVSNARTYWKQFV